MRTRSPLWVLLVSLVTLPSVEGDLDPALKRLLQIQRQAAAHLERQSNYACLESAQRVRRKREGAKPEMADAVHMEVAHIGGRDLYSWPGAEKFEDKDGADLVAGGLIASGSFTSIARNLFVNKVASRRYKGVEDLGGAPHHRYDFWMPVMLSGFSVTTASGSGDVACSGSFWVAADSLDLARLEVRGEDLPEVLGLAAVITTVEYGRVRLAEGDLLMPQRATTLLRHVDGAVSENSVEYTHCRRYGSSARLLESAPGAAPEAPSLRRITLPADLRLKLRLTEEIDSRKARVGDLISAVVESAVKDKRRTLVPEGAIVRGRLRRLEHLTDPYESVMIGIEFNDIEFAGARARFFGYPEGMDPSSGLDRTLLPVARSQVIYGAHGMRWDIRHFENYSHQDLPGVGIFYMKGKEGRIEKGWSMTWRTLRMREN